MEDININGKDTVYFEKDGAEYLSWNESDEIYLIETNANKELLISVAKGIEIIEE